MKTKLWQKENAEPDAFAEIVEKFTVGEDSKFDLQLAASDVIGSLAHAEMLSRNGLLEFGEWKLIEQELNNILSEIKEGKFRIEAGVEDVHSQVEFLLTERIGEAGKKIHSGRSRNDQVLLDIKLYLREVVKSIILQTSELFYQLISLSEKHKSDLLPGYTHFQIAMPSSFGLWFSAYAESLTDDLEMLVAAYAICNKNPLGSGAGYGSSFPLDRKFTTEKLGFATMNYNVVYAQMTRGKTEKIVAMALSNIASTLSKFAYDVCLYMNQNFGFISFPDSLTTGSSIMPHKKNPDVFELIRAKCNRIQSVPNELLLLTNNLPSGYHRDLQLTKEILFPAISELKNCLRMTVFMLQNIEVKKNILEDEKYNALFSVEEVNKEVLSGISFREAYQNVAMKIGSNEFIPEKKINHTHEGSIGNLCLEEIAEEFEKVKMKIN
ncbi:argininosuccinate lyase [soil metagenome]